MPSPDVSSPAEADELGNRFLSEIREQPQALLGLLEHESEFARTAAAARRRGTRLVRMVGHGSSDNAASYGVYTFGLLPRWTALRDSISLTVYYDTSVDMSDSTVIGLSCYRALAVRADARRGRVRETGAEARRLYRGDHEQCLVGARPSC